MYTKSKAHIVTIESVTLIVAEGPFLREDLKNMDKIRSAQLQENSSVGTNHEHHSQEPVAHNAVMRLKHLDATFSEYRNKCWMKYTDDYK